MPDQSSVQGREITGEAPAAGYPRAQINTTTVLISPNETHRQTLKQALEAQLSTTPIVLSAYPSYHDAGEWSEADCDAFVIELDSDSDRGLDIVEAICSRKPSATVLVYTSGNRSELLIARHPRRGPRVLTGTVSPEVLSDALLRAAARRAETSSTKRKYGKVLVFRGAKGGSGATTLAVNFAIAIRQESGQEVALVDLNPQLGDVSLLMGLAPRFTLGDAFRNSARLDEDFMTTLLTKHNSGFSVLAAPDKFAHNPRQNTMRSIMELARNPISVVVDAGSRFDSISRSLFEPGSTYLVPQADIPS